MSAPIGRRFRIRGSVGALRSVVSFYNTSPGLPGRYPSHYFTEMPPEPTPGTVPANPVLISEGTGAQTQAIQFLIKEGIMDIPSPATPATPTPRLRVPGFRRSSFATPGDRVDITFGIDEGERSSQPPPSSRTGVHSDDPGPTPSMHQSATRHRRNLRRLAGEPGLGGP